MSYWMPSKGHEGQLSFQLEDLEQLFTSNTKVPAFIILYVAMLA